MSKHSQTWAEMGSLVMLIMMLFTFVSHLSASAGVEPVVHTKSESKSAIFIVVSLIVIIP